MKNNYEDHININEDHNDDEVLDDLGFHLPLESELTIATFAHLIKNLSRSELKDLIMRMVTSKQLMKKVYKDIFNHHEIEIVEYQGHIQTSYLSGKVEDFYTQLHKQREQEAKELRGFIPQEK